MRQTPTTHHTVQIRHPHALVGQLVPVKLGPFGCAVSWNEPLTRLSAEYHAALGIDGEDIGVHVVIPNVLRAASERATCAGGHEQAVDPPFQIRRDLVHRRAIVRPHIRQVGILVGPEAVLDGLQQRLDAIDPRLEELSRHWVGF